MYIQVLQHFSLVSNSSLVVVFLQKFIAKKQRGVGVEATTGSHVTEREKKEVKPEVIVIYYISTNYVINFQRKFQLTPLLRCEVPRDKAREIEVIFDMIKDKSRRKEVSILTHCPLYPRPLPMFLSTLIPYPCSSLPLSLTHVPLYPRPLPIFFSLLIGYHCTI